MTKSVAVKEEKSVAVQNEVPLGMEGLTHEHIKFPFVALMQAISKSVKDGSFKDGDIVDSLKKTVIEQPFSVVPVIWWDEYRLLKPEGNKMVWESTVTDPNDLRLQGRIRFAQKDKTGAIVRKADVEYVLAFVVLVDNVPMRISFSKTSYGAGQDILTSAKNSGGNLFSHYYEIESAKRVKAGDEWYVFQASQGDPVPSDVHETAKRLYLTLSKKRSELADQATEDVPF